MAVIKVENVEKSFRVFYDKNRSLKEAVLFSNRRKYENRPVLKGINLSVDKGEAIGIIGENGCGKSTLLKLMTRIIYPDKGKITIDGRVSSLIELGAGFHPDMSGRENIYTNAAIYGLGKKEIDRRLSAIIEFSELEDFIDNPVRTYSSGMYMRLAFSVAINVDADVLLIDEILGVGDANFQKKCHEKLDELKKKGVTIAIVSHDLGTVKTFCDKVMWINNGVVEKYGLSGTVIDLYLDFMNGKRRLVRDDSAAETVQKESNEGAAKEDSAENAEAKQPESEGNTPADGYKNAAVNQSEDGKNAPRGGKKNKGKK